MYVLGIHDGHNASAVLLQDGRIIAGVQEERCRNLKNALGMPREAIQDVLAQAEITAADVDIVALAGLHNGEYTNIDPTTNPSDLIVQWHQRRCDRKHNINLKRAIRQLIPDTIYETLRGDRVRQQRLDTVASLGFRRDAIRTVEHHTAHAASAYYGWGKLDEPILVLTNDGMGDDICASISIGQQGRLERLAAVPYTESVGEIYALTTFLLGMVPLEHEYKLMGMAPYASPRSAEVIAEQLAGLVGFEGKDGITWRRKPGLPPLSTAYHYLQQLYRRQRFDHICGGVQRFLEIFLTQWVRNAIAYTGVHKIALAGGVFMNVKANKLLAEMEEVDDIFVFPSCGDETNAIGAAYWAYAEARRQQGLAVDPHPIEDLYWGRAFSDHEIEAAIAAFPFTQKVRVETPPDIERKVAELLARRQVVARLSGRMEFGARALGNRSILANPSDMTVIKVINEMIKKRDFWMPFAPSVTTERFHTYLSNPKDLAAPYMVFAFDSRQEHLSTFAAGIHPYDNTARPQEVMPHHNPAYHRLLQHYGDLTGEEIILNTSFNLHGLPIVYTPEHALMTFDKSGLQHLALGSFLVSKPQSC